MACRQTGLSAWRGPRPGPDPAGRRGLRRRRRRAGFRRPHHQHQRAQRTKAASEKGDGIWAMNADGSEVTLILAGNHFSPAWSPDGQRILFSRFSPD